MRQNTPTNAFVLSACLPQLAEFDLGGVLYHARYFHLYERAREDLLQIGEIAYPDLVREGAHLPLVESHQKFFLPVEYGKPFDLFLWVQELRRSSFTFCYHFVDTQKQILHSAWTTHVFVKKEEDGFLVQRVPDRLQELLAQYTAEAHS